MVVLMAAAAAAVSIHLVLQVEAALAVQSASSGLVVHAELQHSLQLT